MSKNKNELGNNEWQQIQEVIDTSDGQDEREKIFLCQYLSSHLIWTERSCISGKIDIRNIQKFGY